jgi:hypothetical protein
VLKDRLGICNDRFLGAPCPHLSHIRIQNPEVPSSSSVAGRRETPSTPKTPTKQHQQKKLRLEEEIENHPNPAEYCDFTIEFSHSFINALSITSQFTNIHTQFLSPYEVLVC